MDFSFMCNFIMKLSFCQMGTCTLTDKYKVSKLCQTHVINYRTKVIS